MRLWSTFVAVALLVASLGAVPALVPASNAAQAADGPCVGTISEQPDSLTVVSVQGAKFDSNGSSKTAARVVAFHPNGSIAWVHHSAEQYGVVWSYDIDPLPNGNLFVTATQRIDGEGQTLLYELDAETGKPLWSEQLDMLDTHDADMLNRTHIAIANMRNYDEEAGQNNDRLAIYNRTSDEIEWSWYFRDHYDESVGGRYEEDWTHVNDVDAVGDRYLLASPRNFDQTILVDRQTGDIEMKLGSDGDFSVMKKQHNPDYLESESGDPTFLVADSENERIIEYAREDSEWNKTWSVGSGETLAWPRDADRLPNGNTLLADSRNDRVLEITPDGEVVWEVYAPYLVYDVERVPGDGSNGPTMADEGVSGHQDLSNAAPPSEETLEPCAAAIDEHEGGFGQKLLSPRGTDGTDAGATSTDWAEGTQEDDVITTRGDSSVFSPLGPLVPLAALGVVVAVLAFRSRRE
jgi:hypothetical protein